MGSALSSLAQRAQDLGVQWGALQEATAGPLAGEPAAPAEGQRLEEVEEQ
jgi:hypothetical protein